MKTTENFTDKADVYAEYRPYFEKHSKNGKSVPQNITRSYLGNV